VSFVYFAFLALAWVGLECLIGGTRLIYSLPAYGLLSLGALLTLASIRSKRTPPDAFCIGSTLLLGAWILIRAWRSPIEYLARPDFFMMLACLMTYLLTAIYLTGAREQTCFIVVTWVIAALEIWVGIVQFVKDPKFMLFGLMRPGYLRASGMYISPNNFAGLLVAVAIISISAGIWSTWRAWVKILALYIAACCLLGVAISGSRGGYFDMIGSLVCFAVGSTYAIRVADPRKFLPVALLCAAGLVGVVALAAFLMAHSDLLTRRMNTMVVKDVRIYNWEAAIDHIRLSPWVGTGAGTHLIYGRLFRRPQIQANPVHAHCDYLELLAEYGVVGALCMALFLTAHIRNGLRSYSTLLRGRLIPSGILRSDRFAIQWGALCAVAGLGIHSVVDFDMHIPGNALLFAFLFGILASPGIKRPLGLVDNRVTPWAALLLPALGIFTLWRSLPMLPTAYCTEMARRALRNGVPLDAISYAEKGLGSAGPGEQDLLDKLLRKTGPDPANPDLYFYLGEGNRALGMRLRNIYLRRDYFAQASAAYEAGLKVFPQDENMLVRDGQVLDALRRFDDAEAMYRKALAWDPKLDAIYAIYETHLIAEGMKPEAAAQIRQRMEPKADEVVETEPSGDFRLK
jgi:O-antigen ligase